MFNKVAKGRPDAKDHQVLDKYANLCAAKLKRFATTDISQLKAKPAPLEIKGSMPTKGPMKMPLRPSANKDCVKCGLCASVCPTGAIDKKNPTKVDSSKCISCTTCINVCPNNARGFFGPIAGASGIAFEKLCSKRKEPEWFL
jgi:ferredoxin